MQLGRVIGSVVSMRKVGNLKGLTLLVVDYLDENLKSKNKCIFAGHLSFKARQANSIFHYYCKNSIVTLYKF